MKSKLLFIAFTSLILLTGCDPAEDPQEIVEISLSTNIINVPPEGGNYKVAVTSDTEWKIVQNNKENSWYSLFSLHDMVHIDVTRSDSETTKRASFKVQNSTDTKSITIVQAGWEVQESGVFIDGIVWATCNVGEFGEFTESPFHPGRLYQFNDSTAYTTVEYDTINGYRKTVPDWKYMPISYTWLPENNPCPPGWRLPTDKEIRSLINSGYKYDSSLNGFFFGPNSATATLDDNKECIFLPLGGQIWGHENGSSVYGVFTEGFYWTKSGSYTYEGKTYSDYLRLNFFNDHEASFVMANTSLTNGYSIRCVKE